MLQKLLRDCEITSLLAEVDRLRFERVGNSICGTAEQWVALQRAMYGDLL